MAYRPTTVADLIAALQALPQDLPVYTSHTPDCCCGECFLPYPVYAEADRTPSVTEAHLEGYDRPATQVVIL